jgi:hypothetical protein
VSKRNGRQAHHLSVPLAPFEPVEAGQQGQSVDLALAAAAAEFLLQPVGDEVQFGLSALQAGHQAFRGSRREGRHTHLRRAANEECGKERCRRLTRAAISH